jgi:signal transduction histidine kinase
LNLAAVHQFRATAQLNARSLQLLDSRHAGISEGLLSGCCGILNESVRRQIYIVRTSGARLLALINDVMDAAALRQHRLVLKQERMELRQLVGDVSDLTRSLVDNEVSLRNEVPEGMLVWADSGRIIQVG